MLLKTCVGFCWVEVPPSPKSQSQLVITAPAPGGERSVKLIVAGRQPRVWLAVNEATGEGKTVI